MLPDRADVSLDDLTPPARPWKLAEGNAGTQPAFARTDGVHEGVVAMSIHGALDTGHSSRIARQILQVLALPINGLRVNLAQLEFIDSAGLGVLNITRIEALHRGIRFTLAGVPGPVRRVLDVSGMLAVFEIDGADGAPEGAEG